MVITVAENKLSGDIVLERQAIALLPIPHTLQLFPRQWSTEDPLGNIIVTRAENNLMLDAVHGR